MSERKKIIMSVFYLFDPIIGNDKLMDCLFRIQQKLDFIAFRFLDFDIGPVDFQVYAELQSLEDEGLLKITKGMNENGTVTDRYELTELGQEKAKKEFESMDTKIKMIIASMK